MTYASANLVTSSSLSLAIYSQRTTRLAYSPHSPLGSTTHCDQVTASNHGRRRALQLDALTIRRPVLHPPQVPAMRADVCLIDTVPTVS